MLPHRTPHFRGQHYSTRGIAYAALMINVIKSKRTRVRWCSEPLVALWVNERIFHLGTNPIVRDISRPLSNEKWYLDNGTTGYHDPVDGWEMKDDRGKRKVDRKDGYTIKTTQLSLHNPYLTHRSVRALWSSRRLRGTEGAKVHTYLGVDVRCWWEPLLWCCNCQIGPRLKLKIPKSGIHGATVPAGEMWCGKAFHTFSTKPVSRFTLWYTSKSFVPYM
jgi:hypothetical protein